MRAGDEQSVESPADADASSDSAGSSAEPGNPSRPDGDGADVGEGSDDDADSAGPASGSTSGPASKSTTGVPDGGSVEHEVDAPDSEPTFSGAPDDEEMPLTDHIEEMLIRLFYVIIVMATVSAFTFFFADELINFFWYSFLPGAPEQCAAGEGVACPRVYHPLGLIFARLKVASLVGFIVALPVFVYQTYLFMRPGLYPHERRYYLASVPTSLVLALVGVAFAYFLILPVIFRYFLYYSEGVADIAFGLTETFDLIILMMGLFAAIFQIPLFIMLAIMMGVTTRYWLEDKRILFWFGFGGLAFLFSPDPTGMAPLMVAATMIALFELTLLLLRWTGR